MLNVSLMRVSVRVRAKEAEKAVFICFHLVKTAEKYKIESQ